MIPPGLEEAVRERTAAVAEATENALWAVADHNGHLPHQLVYPPYGTDARSLPCHGRRRHLWLNGADENRTVRVSVCAHCLLLYQPVQLTGDES